MGSNPTFSAKSIKSPYFRDFFVVIKGVFDNFLRINLMIIVNLLPHITYVCNILHTNCA